MLHQEVAVQSQAKANVDAADEAKKLREQRKQEAIERSRQRQADKEYFLKKQELNKKPEKPEGGKEETAEVRMNVCMCVSQVSKVYEIMCSTSMT
jgi:hypothetical protein